MNLQQVQLVRVMDLVDLEYLTDVLPQHGFSKAILCPLVGHETSKNKEDGH